MLIKNQILHRGWNGIYEETTEEMFAHVKVSMTLQNQMETWYKIMMKGTTLQTWIDKIALNQLSSESMEKVKKRFTWGTQVFSIGR